MRSYKAILAALAVPALVLATSAQAAATRAAQGTPAGGGGGQSCEGQIVQGTVQGGFDLERVIESGRCFCRVTLGPGGPAADSTRVTNALDRCVNSAAGGGGGGSTGLIVGGVVTAAGLAAGLATGGNDSPR